MTSEDWFAADVGADFEESVRIDREDDNRDHRLESIDTYHVTDEAEQFLVDFFDRLLGHSADMRSGANYWLYGYYGSGKSHLLSVLRGLLDSAWLRERGAVWDELADDRDLPALESTWESIHDEYEVIPLSVNLLKHQGQKDRSFSEILLQAAHTSERLTGVDGGFSPQLDVAYFEDWYRTTAAWSNRTGNAQSVLADVVDNPSTYEWDDVQRYHALADAVLPALFETETGTEDGLDDLVPSDLDPEAMVRRLDTLRRERAAELGRPVKLVLLLDEVSLFIGTDFDRLTELQTLAESVDEIGDGDIQLVATAQAQIEDVQPQFAARGADFSIVKDRFPHRFGLPSRHVGEISTQRLLKKTPDGRAATERVLDRVDNDPATLLVYSGIDQKTDPPLNDIDHQRLIEFYPFLPYQPALFLDILSNLREQARDPAKSIFSGTARAILALVHGLLEEWLEDGQAGHTISLVDFYDLIERELVDITPQDVEVIDDIEEEHQRGDLHELDVDVAKAVLLLQHISDTIPMTERNLGVAVLSDLDGPTQFQMENRVEDALQRLRKFIRPAHDDSGPAYAFTHSVEREIIEAAEENLNQPDWDSILNAVDEYLWQDVVRDLTLPTSVEYGDTGEQYPVRYEFTVDGHPFSTTVDADDALDVEVAIEGLSPISPDADHDGDPLEWTVGGDGLDDLRDTLIEWWALRAAVGDSALPQSVERDLSDRASRVRSKLREALRNGSFDVKDRTDLSGLSRAVEEFVDVHYPDDFHPVMLQVDDSYLRELRDLTAQDPLPTWAKQIEVATENPETYGGSIQNNVRAFTGQQLKQRDGSLAMATLLDGIVERKPIYADARPALCAIIWGLCRKGDFRPVDEAGDPLENDAVIDYDNLATTRLKISGGDGGLRDILREGGFIDSTETLPDGIVRLQTANESLANRLNGLAEDVDLVAENDIQTQPVLDLLQSFVEALEQQRAAALDRHDEINARNTDWEQVVEATNDAQNWYEDAQEVWNLRLAELAKLDGVLTLAAQPFDWITDECEATRQTLHQRLRDYDGTWWTADGWNHFNGVQTTSPPMDDLLAGAWDAFVDSTGLDSLATDLVEHPWIRPPTEFESNVLSSFETTYLLPLYRLLTWYQSLADAVDTVTASATSTDADEFIRATDTLGDPDPLQPVSADQIDDRRDTFEQLQTIVEDRTPDDVAVIGRLQADRDGLESELERLAQRHDLQLEETEDRVIVR